MAEVRVVDEFWWPRDGSLREVLEAVPPSFGTIRGWGRHIVARPETGEPFYELMTVRRRPTDVSGSPYGAGFKTAHRATPDVLVTRGNHNAFGRGLRPLRDWKPCEVFHFPIRTQVQMERKFLRLETSLGDHPGSRHERQTATPTLADDVSLASDFADFHPADTTVRLEARIDGLGRRLETLER